MGYIVSEPVYTTTASFPKPSGDMFYLNLLPALRSSMYRSIPQYDVNNLSFICSNQMFYSTFYPILSISNVSLFHAVSLYLSHFTDICNDDIYSCLLFMLKLIDTSCHSSDSYNAICNILGLQLFIVNASDLNVTCFYPEFTVRNTRASKGILLLKSGNQYNPCVPIHLCYTTSNYTFCNEFPCKCLYLMKTATKESIDEPQPNDKKHTSSRLDQHFSKLDVDTFKCKDALSLVKDFKMKYPKNMIIGHYNVNSVRNKMTEVGALLYFDLVHILCICETKLDSSFPKAQFEINGYKQHREDRNADGGGIMIYVNEFIPHKKLTDFTGVHLDIEFMTIELHLKSGKCCLFYVYKPPKVSQNIFYDFMIDKCETLLGMCKLYLVIGDLNCNWLVNGRIHDLCDLFNLTNLVKDNTCFKGSPSLIDYILTDRPRCFNGVINLDYGSSDFHNLILTATKAHAPYVPRKKITYRSMQHFNEQSFVNDLCLVPFYVCNIFDDVDDIYWASSLLYTNILNEHAPLKTRQVRGQQAPHFNADLRKAMHLRNRCRSLHFKNKHNKKLRFDYTNSRNAVVRINKNSIATYFDKKCGPNASPRDFYPTVKPYLSSKMSGKSKIILQEDGNIITDDLSIANIFNEFYANIAQYDNGCHDGLDLLDVQSAIYKHEGHPSISLIQSKINVESRFNFKCISCEDFYKCLKTIPSNKAPGHDGLSGRFIKMCDSRTIEHFCSIFNKCILECRFPHDLKIADISPVYKKDDSLCKNNYRSVNVLVVLSKVFEKMVANQLSEFILNLLHAKLSAYRKGYSCQHVLLQLTEYWRDALDDHDFAGAIATDLSKAFDSMPHALLIAKLYNYGLSITACEFIADYLKNRMQRIKVGNCYSDLSVTNRGVPQGSVFGPLLFNIFLNDMFFLDIDSSIVNYADDNHLCNRNQSLDTLVDILNRDTNTSIEWFDNNLMKSNADKFQGMILSRDGPVNVTFNIQHFSIKSQHKMKTLGVVIDDSLKFNEHITNICSRASGQINALKRLSCFLNESRRLNIYISFVNSNFNYCPLSWIFCGKNNAEKLEKLQKRALRFVYNDYTSDYDFLLSKSNLLSLSMTRLKLLCIEVYKCMTGQNPEYLNNMFHIKMIPYGLRDSSRSLQHRWGTKSYGFKSFQYYGSKVWNSIPPDIKKSSSLDEFKSKIHKWCLTPKAKSLEIF